MKKFLSIFALLMTIVIGARATDFVDTYGSLGTVTGDYIANGISKITLGENAKANGGIQAETNGATLKFTVSTPDGFTIKTVRFKDSNVDESNITCNDATGTLATSSHYTTLTASANKTSVEFTIPSSSGKAAKLTEFTITVSSSTTDDYELITPQSISDNVITYTSSLGDDKLVTAMAGVGGPSVENADLNFGNGRGFTLTTSRPIKAVYCVWYQRCPISDTGWQGYSDAGATTVTGSYSVETNAWEAPDEETTFVAFKTSEGATHKISSIHIFYYASNEPSISADNININEGAVLDGEISFSVEKKGTTGTVSAVDNADWLTLGEVDNTNGKVPFTTTANTAATSRSATVTLTYTYNTSETVTKNVTITQAAEVRGTEIIKAVLKDSPTGTIGGTADYNTQNRDANNGGCKLGSNGHYVGIKLATGNTFRNGDIIKVNIGTGASGNFVFYEDKGVTPILETTEVASTGLHTFVLPAAVDGKNSIYLYRHDTSFNPYVDYISVTRPNAVVTLNDGGEKFTKGFTTYCADANFTVTNGTAYKAAIAGGKMTMTALEGVIPANTGVVIAGDKEANVAITATTNDATADVSGNALHGTTVRTLTSTLKGEAAKFLAFNKSDSTFKPYGGEYFPANKAYILLDSNDTAQSLEMVFDDATGINVVNANETEAKVAPVKVIKNGQLFIGNYNVAGARVK